mmetsp:Transcript_4586/g.12765  ORF Transcript_4586/g.12765 Transcript_4586/m.12765 type:complete len:255 (-) Transcript_4586:200-964(-)
MLLLPWLLHCCHPYQQMLVLCARLLTGGALCFQLDIHHCDAVQECFYHSPKVLCISLHKRSPGFFPGSGSSSELGGGEGLGYNLNLPLKDGLSDETFVSAFKLLVGQAATTYLPECVVLQCGADGLSGDPVGGSFALGPAAHAAAVSAAAGWGVPLLLLGGGGYSSPAASRCWTLATAAAAGRDLVDDVPEHEHLMEYGPDFRLHTLPQPSLRPDLNSCLDVEEACERLLLELRSAVALREPQGSGGASNNAAS